MFDNHTPMQDDSESSPVFICIGFAIQTLSRIVPDEGKSPYEIQTRENQEPYMEPSALFYNSEN